MNTQKNTYVDSYGMQKSLINSALIYMEGRQYYVHIELVGYAGNPVYLMRVVRKGKEHFYNIEAKVEGLEDATNKRLYLVMMDAICVKGDKQTSFNTSRISHLFESFTDTRKKYGGIVYQNGKIMDGEFKPNKTNK
tara:strand:+ start:569 stop:976 length:408 start_codon:yes stop_codon:yes gene_type:complete